MAKKNADNAVELTPEQAVEALANERLLIDQQIKELTAKKDEITGKLEEFVAKSGATIVGPYKVSLVEKDPVIDFGTLTAGQKKAMLEQLQGAFPQYTKTKTDLDVSRLFYDSASNPLINDAMKVRGLAFVKPTSYRFTAN